MKRIILFFTLFIANESLIFSNSKYPSFFCFGKFFENPVNSIMAVSWGLREIYSDWLYIKLLQYYGTRERGEGVYFEWGSGNYPLFYDKAKEIVILNPYFKNAVMSSAGVLAFNLNKYYQGISILKLALLYQSDNYDYMLLLSAIVTFQTKKNIYDEKLINELYEICVRKDVPIMLIQMTAFISKKAGYYDKAIELYSIILNNSKDKFYIENARKQIELIRKVKSEK